MGTEAISSALRLELRPGEWVLWDARPHRFESLAHDRARIRDATNDELREVSISEIRALLYLPAAELDVRIDQQRTVDPEEWTLAEKREAVIREVLIGDGPTKARVQIAAAALRMSSRAVYRLVARYRISAQTTSLLPRRRGPNKTLRRLGDARERLIEEAIGRRYLVRPRTPMEEVYRNVKKRCRELNIPAPARGSVLTRIQALDTRHVARRRLGSKEAQAIARSTPGELEASSALEPVDISYASRLVRPRNDLVGGRIAAGHAVSCGQSVSGSQSEKRVRDARRDAREPAGNRARDRRRSCGDHTQLPDVGKPLGG